MSIKEIAQSFRHTPTAEEKRQGLLSSISSEGPIGKINRGVAKVTGQQEVDIVGFVKGFTLPE